MKKLRSFVSFTLASAFSFITGPGCGGNPGTAGLTAESGKYTVAHTAKLLIDSLMKAHFAADGPGVVLAMQQDTPGLTNDSTERVQVPLSTYCFATGLADLTGTEQVTDSSVFNIGSLTKQFTARMILNLVQDGKLFLTDPIGKYLSRLPAPVAALKISQLLSHCSGIPDHYGYTDTNKVKHAKDEDVLEAIRKADRLYFPAGTRFRYSNTAYCLLGMLIEKVSGWSYEIAISNHLYFPTTHPGNLKLSSLSFLPASAVIGHRVHGYDKNKKGEWVSSDAPESIFFTTQADGGMLISMKDYMTWCRLAGSNYNYETSRNVTPIIASAMTAHTIVDTASGLYYGYGWFVLPRKNESGPFFYHTGFNGGFRTSVLLIPSIGYRIAIFSASPQADLEDLVHQINLILGVDDKGFIRSGPLES